jgi:hypothetical protein
MSKYESCGTFYLKVVVILNWFETCFFHEFAKQIQQAFRQKTWRVLEDKVFNYLNTQK